MRQELQDKLSADFPQIFQDVGCCPTKSCMAFGLEVGDGWYDLIHNLCQAIMATNPPEDFKAAQVKEKFGGLRFYTDGCTEETYRLVNLAEDDSYKICEDCGSRENVTCEPSPSWITTLCKGCRNK